MASPLSSNAANGGGGGYKRASRKGAPRRFGCDYPGCDKLYSRAEHLQRHQLNHNPKEIFRCDVPECDQKFVRADLLARHKKRHTSSYVPRNRVPSFSTLREQTAGPGPGSATTSPNISSQPRPEFQQPLPPAGPHDAAILLTPESNVTPAPAALGNSLTNRSNQGLPAAWGSPINERVSLDMMRPRTSYYGGDTAALPEPSVIPPFPDMQYGSDEPFAQENFATWLFDPQTNYGDFSVTSIPFMEAGLESTFNNNIQYDYESLTSRSQIDHTSPGHLEMSDELMSEARRQELLHWFQVFRKKQPKYENSITNLVRESGGDLPALNLEMMRDCLKEFWDNVSPRLPIVHQHTFAANRCPILLLLVMVALGAASMRNRDVTGQLNEYGAFADVIISSVRWEILTSDDAVPPIGLWVAQALVLLEFYEKLYSTRRFHERAHIYHSAFLTLLRRGSPLIGRAGSESPAEPSHFDGDRDSSLQLDSRAWWVRWAETESMHRVVFVAFMLDVCHAAMFGHAADMAAHEIRLPLPCDDNLWTANSPDEVRQLDANLRMYGVKQVSFLDGLKSALHGKEVKTHSFGRMIIMSGLLSVGWHLSHRETHLKWLDMRPSSTETTDNWRKMLLHAFDNWKHTFDGAMSDAVSDGHSQRGSPNGPINSAALLYHLAHISLHVNIVDCQIFAGAKRLVGRRVSSRDYTNAVKRMSNWAKLSSTRHAVLHAFKLLHQVLVQPHAKRRSGPYSLDPIPYSVRNEVDPHRPWVMYYAILSIWSFVQAISPPSARGYPPRLPHINHNSYARMVEYLSNVASLHVLDERTAAMLSDGLPELLYVMESIIGEAGSELLVEARVRVKVCRDMHVGTG